MGKTSAVIYTKVPLNLLAYDTTNPRKHDLELLNKIAISIKKIGLIMPIVAMKNGVILGGHQRVKTLRMLGIKDAYVNYISDSNESERMTINMYLNRVIQELKYTETNNSDIEESNLKKIDELPDLEEPSHVLSRVTFEDIECSYEYNNKRDYLLFKEEKYLMQKGVRLPIIVDSKNRIVNGNIRFYAYKEKNIKPPILKIEDSLVPYVTMLLRGVSNKFSFDDKDYLRVSSRRHIVSNSLSKDYQLIYGKYRRKCNFSIYVENVKRRLGTYILDFGCGNGKQTARLRQNGVNIVMFEPFVPTSGMISKVSVKKTKESYDQLISELKKNEPFNSVVASAVLNSVATKEDVECVVYLLKVFSIGGMLFGSTRCEDNNQQEESGFIIGKNEKLCSGYGKNKVQRFLKESDILNLFGDDVTMFRNSSKNYLFYRKSYTGMEVDLNILKKAIETEFNFFYTDRHLDYRQEVFDVMKKRLEIFEQKNLCKIKA